MHRGNSAKHKHISRKSASSSLNPTYSQLKATDLPPARAGARVAAVVPLVRPRRAERVAALHGSASDLLTGDTDDDDPPRGRIKSKNRRNRALISCGRGKKSRPGGLL